MTDSSRNRLVHAVVLAIWVLPACGRSNPKPGTRDASSGEDLVAADFVADARGAAADLTAADWMMADKPADERAAADDPPPAIDRSPELSSAADASDRPERPPVGDAQDSGTPDQTVVDARDAGLDQPAGADLSGNPDGELHLDGGVSDLCNVSGGTIAVRSCCASTVALPQTCGAVPDPCACSTADSHDTEVCTCPDGACYLPEYGCVGPASTCTVGRDQTCNDSPIISSIHGRCVADGRCLCTTHLLSPTSGKCL